MDRVRIRNDFFFQQMTEEILSEILRFLFVRNLPIHEMKKGWPVRGAQLSHRRPRLNAWLVTRRENDAPMRGFEAFRHAMNDTFVRIEQ